MAVTMIKVSRREPAMEMAVTAADLRIRLVIACSRWTASMPASAEGELSRMPKT
jgi:hypothetical protein